MQGGGTLGTEFDPVVSIGRRVGGDGGGAAPADSHVVELIGLKSGAGPSVGAEFAAIENEVGDVVEVAVIAHGSAGVHRDRDRGGAARRSRIAEGIIPVEVEPSAVIDDDVAGVGAVVVEGAALGELKHSAVHHGVAGVGVVLAERGPVVAGEGGASRAAEGLIDADAVAVVIDGGPAPIDDCRTQARDKIPVVLVCPDRPPAETQVAGSRSLPDPTGSKCTAVEIQLAIAAAIQSQRHRLGIDPTAVHGHVAAALLADHHEGFRGGMHRTAIDFQITAAAIACDRQPPPHIQASSVLVEVGPIVCADLCVLPEIQRGVVVIEVSVVELERVAVCITDHPDEVVWADCEIPIAKPIGPVRGRPHTADWTAYHKDKRNGDPNKGSG